MYEGRNKDGDWASLWFINNAHVNLRLRVRDMSQSAVPFLVIQFQALAASHTQSLTS